MENFGEIRDCSHLFKKVIKQQSILFACLAIFVTAFYFLTIFSIEYNSSTFFGKFYWAFGGTLLLIFLVYSVLVSIRAKHSKGSLALNIADKIDRFGFLLKQLIIKDFKTKYKRSILGIFWSFLNPLLMMGVQYLVFSTFFDNSSIDKYPVYLIIGVIFFSFASEASSIGLTSITSNANLINKVYVPKWIYPISKVISSLINFAFTIIPLEIIMIVCKVYPSPYHLLFFFNVFLLFIFLLGLVFLLSSLMTFFRDTQFIWGIISLIWMYATPIFYSLDFIQNEAIRTALKFNPLYHYITVTRIVLISHTSPQLISYLYCIGFSAIMFVIGAIVFKLTQRKFVLHV